MSSIIYKEIDKQKKYKTKCEQLKKKKNILISVGEENTPYI